MSAETPYTDEWVTGSQNTKLFVRMQAPATIKGAVVFVHGFIEHLARYDLVRETLVSKGFAVLFYDQRGFGQSALNVKNRSPGSSYGKNTRQELLDDVQCMLNLAKERFKTENLYLYGHSMGGAIVLQYTCVGTDDLQVKRHLRGVVATSPLLRQTNPEAAIKLAVGRVAAKLMPWMLVPAPVNAKMLCHDEEVHKAYMLDPLIVQKGTLRGLETMLNGGISLAENDYRQWPEAVPLLLIHGSDDQVTCPKASQLFHDNVKATDKTIKIIKGALHEIHNEPEFKVSMVNEIGDWLNAHVPKAGAATEAAAEPASEPAASVKL